MGFNLADYEEVKDRIPRFWAKHPEGAIVTEIVECEAAHYYIVQATLINGNGQKVATGLAEELVADRGVNKTSALENCETSAIGRALANAGFASGKNRPSREEMDKAARADSPGGAGRDRGSSRPSTTPGRPATDKQRKHIERLVEQTGIVPESWPLPNDLSMRDASALIDRLQAEEKMPKGDERKSTMRTDVVAAELGAEVVDDERPF